MCVNQRKQQVREFTRCALHQGRGAQNSPTAPHKKRVEGCSDLFRGTATEKLAFEGNGMLDNRVVYIDGARDDARPRSTLFMSQKIVSSTRQASGQHHCPAVVAVESSGDHETYGDQGR